MKGAIRYYEQAEMSNQSIKALTTLFQAMFSSAELRRWVRGLPGGVAIANALPGEIASHAELCFQTALTLENNGRVDAALFDALRATFPSRHDAIQEVAVLCGVSLEQPEICSQQTLPPPISRRISLTLLAVAALLGISTLIFEIAVPVARDAGEASSLAVQTSAAHSSSSGPIYPPQIETISHPTTRNVATSQEPLPAPASCRDCVEVCLVTSDERYLGIFSAALTGQLRERESVSQLTECEASDRRAFGDGHTLLGELQVNLRRDASLSNVVFCEAGGTFELQDSVGRILHGTTIDPGSTKTPHTSEVAACQGALKLVATEVALVVFGGER